MKTAGKDREAFRLVYTLTSAKLFGICLRICGDRQGAEDVLHEIFLIVWRRAGVFDPARGSAIAWLSAVARNRSIDWFRAQDVRATEPLATLPEMIDPAPLAETQLILRETCLRISACLDELRPCQRDAIRTAFFEGVTYAASAERSGIPVGTIKSWIRRGLRELWIRLDAADIGSV